MLEYDLSGILLKRDDGYLLDHDFAFPDRPGAIDRFELHLTFDPAWQPVSDVRPVYTAFGLAPGQRFVLTIPLRYTGAGAPITCEGLSVQTIQIAVAIVLGVTALLIGAFFIRETRYGRFVPVTTEGIDDA